MVLGRPEVLIPAELEAQLLGQYLLNPLVTPVEKSSHHHGHSVTAMILLGPYRTGPAATMRKKN